MSIALTMLWQDVCSSVSQYVRLSVTRRYSVYSILKLFSPLGSHTILIFPHQTVWQHSDGDPPNGGVECKGAMKKSRFSTNISLYLRNDTRYRWNTNRDVYTPYSGGCYFDWPWVILSDLAKYQMTRSAARAVCDEIYTSSSSWVVE